VIDKYGADHVSQIITFGTLAARAAVRDVGRALGMTYADTDAVARLIPRQLGITLKDAMQGEELKSLYESSPKIQRLLDTAAALEGMPRHASTHAAGVVITDLPTSEYVPLALSSDTVVTQYDMDTIASLGLLKFDFLALRYLTIISDTEKMVRRSEPNFNIERIPLDDPETFELIGQGRTDGMFQLESGGMRQLLQQFKPESVEDIMIAIALYRPGPMEAIPQFLENRKNREAIVYENEALRNILEETCGCIVYQEQIMQIFRVIAGYSYGKADIVRRAIAKKKAGVIEEERDNFIKGAAMKDMPEESAVKLFESMIAFSNYGFKKSHAAAYAVLSYRTAYLKRHYPAFYLSALLTSVLGNMPKTAQYIGECSRCRIKILPPDINRSEKYYHSDGDSIRIGLLAIKNVGPSLAEALINERRESPYKSFIDFVERVPSGELNKAAAESLINAGTFDSLGVKRSVLSACFKDIMDSHSERNRRNVEGQLNMFAIAGGAGIEEYEYPELDEFSVRQKLALERESTGLYLSGHLLDEYSSHIEMIAPVSLGEVNEAFENPETAAYHEKDTVTAAGLITKRNVKQTKNGDVMAFITIEDRYSEIEILVFPKLFEQFGELLQPDCAVSITGELSQKDDEPPKMLMRTMRPLLTNAEFAKLRPQPPQTVQTPPQYQPPQTAQTPPQYQPPQTAQTPPQYQPPHTAQTPPQYQPPQTAQIPSQYLPHNPQIPSQYLRPQQIQTEPPKPQRLFVRVQNTEVPDYKRALCLIEIFAGET
nr:DNA polymerase III subunit alpha [Clostridia bacterium]